MSFKSIINSKLSKRLLNSQIVKFFGTTANSTEPVLTVKQGKLKGAVEKIYNGDQYFSFKGIPYATPPIGKLRFSAPQPPQSWQGTLDATEHGPVCPQYDINMRQYTEGDENCLFLNVYTKSLQSNSKLPVMVYIHGGGYVSGSGDSNFLGPQYFLQHDIVLITFNYRLEVLGFLCLDTPEVPGNAGLKDQLAALRWVKDNIRHFGGDPDNITLFGESAGGSSVLYHLQNPRTEGLFHKAIAQSGVHLSDWAQGTDGRSRAFKVGKTLGKDTNDTSELLEFLRGVPAIKLTKMTTNVLMNDEKHRGLPLHFVPVVEKKFENVEPFITENPLSSVVHGKLRNLPLIVGYNSSEGIVVLGDQIKKKEFYNKNPHYYLPREVARRLSEEKLKEFGDKVKKFYFGNEDIGPENLQSLVNVNSDVLFVYNIHRFLNLYSQLNKDVFMYVFDTVTELNIVKQMSGFPHAKGMCHADDLFYFFHSIMTSDYYEEQERLRDIVFKVTKLWVDFAKNSNPTPEGSSVTWPRYTPVKRDFLVINETFRTDQFPHKDRVDFWDKLYEEAGLPNKINVKSNL